MSIKRYQAADMRSALRQIREEQGDGAVIISTRTTAGGVEVCAGSDSAPTPTPTPTPAVAGTVPGALNEELRSLRRLLETQLAALTWNDFTRREPRQARAFNELTALGVTRAVAWAIVRQLESLVKGTEDPYLHYSLLAEALPTVGSPTEEGGVVALFGPAGTGKSTVLAKLALEWVGRHGADGLVLVTTDEERLGAAEQMAQFARLLQVPWHRATSAVELGAHVGPPAKDRLVLVDSAGFGARDDAALRRLAGTFAAVPELRRVLVLSAAAQPELLGDTVRRLGPLAPACAIITHLDETLSLGGLFSAVIAARMPMALQSEGAPIPVGLRPVRATELVARAIDLASREDETPANPIPAEVFHAAA